MLGSKAEVINDVTFEIIKRPHLKDKALDRYSRKP